MTPVSADAPLIRRARTPVSSRPGCHGPRRIVIRDDVRIESWELDPGEHDLTVGASETVTLAGLLSGSARFGSTAHETEARVGHHHLLVGEADLRVLVESGARALAIGIPIARLPRSGPLPAPRIDSHSRIGAVLFSLADHLVTAPPDRKHHAAARATTALADSLLMELFPEERAAPLGQQISDYIDAHLDDPDLQPRSIAQHFHVSLRWVHRAFGDDDGATIARTIRLRRVERVAEQVRLAVDEAGPAPQAPTTTQRLAHGSGFRTGDAMTRAFKARYGVTVAEYAAQHLAHQRRSGAVPERDDRDPQ